MRDYKPKVGDRVKVTMVVEGKVFESSKYGFGLLGRWYDVADRSIASVEKLPDPEPEWRYGHVVKDANSQYWWYTGGAWQQMFDTGHATVNVSDDYPLRPLAVISAPVEDES